MKRLFKLGALAGALSLLWSPLVSAQLALSLDQAQTLGVAQAYAMQRARIDVDVARRDIKELLATGLPQVSASFDVNHFLDIPTQVVPATSFNPMAPEDLVLELAFGTTQSATAGFNATQLVFSGSYLVGVKAAQVFADAKALAVDATEVETRRLVAEAYVTALAAEANAETLDRALTLVAASEQEVRALVEEGLLESVDSDQLQLSRQALEQQLSTARLQADLT
ncbi:MAG TPA: hypothetical protein DCS71_00830, partial [Flavobacteriales bacterium]|nr:hypothetical protein [Flavobacteriales bacterium]